MELLLEEILLMCFSLVSQSFILSLFFQMGKEESSSRKTVVCSPWLGAVQAIMCMWCDHGAEAVEPDRLPISRIIESNALPNPL